MSPTEFSINIYTHSLSVRIFLAGPQTKIIHQKTLIGDLWFTGNNFNDGFTN